MPPDETARPRVTRPDTAGGPALALFDLDHTLLPGDSGMLFTAWLESRGLLPAGAEACYLAACQAYVDGRLDVPGLHRALLLPLAAVGASRIAGAAAEFADTLDACWRPAMRERVAAHRAAGDLCAIVTATSRPVAEPFARALGVALVATEPARSGLQDSAMGGRGAGSDSADAAAIAARTARVSPAARIAFPTWNGEIDGTPCHGPHKPAHVARWLARAGHPPIAAFRRSWFYSDAAGDLPLLRCVTDPVAVAPDARLRAVAVGEGWTVIEG